MLRANPFQFPFGVLIATWTFIHGQCAGGDPCYPFESDLGTEIGFLTFHPAIESPANRLQEGFNKGIR